jgi:putative DNA primase/helicase
MHTIVDGRCSCGADPNCPRPAKHPITRHGVKDATTDHEQIVKWWTEHPNANIGIATGQQSGILALDIDPRNGGTQTLQLLEKELGALPPTVTSNTGGGGEHRIFKYPSFAVRKDSAGKLFGPGVDVLSDGCIMVAPPSRHASGKYRWQEGKSFRDLKPAPLPERWLERLNGNVRAHQDADCVAAATAEHIAEGQRNTRLTSLAGTLQRRGVASEVIKAALMAENATTCMPPLDEAEVEKIVASVSKYPAAQLGDGADAAEGLMQLVLDQHFSGGRHLMLSTDGQFWHYDVRLWRVVPVQWVHGKVLETIQKNPVNNQKTLLCWAKSSSC